MPQENLVERVDIINRSWKRCQNFGLSPSDPMDDSILTGSALQEVLTENQSMIRHATLILENLYPAIHSQGLVTVIVDRNGTIIHKVGHLDNNETIDYLPVGSNWSEKRKGTNAMGLAIYEKKPIITHAEHHFYVKNHFLTCAASPIYSPTGELIGAVNISAKKEMYHLFTISLTMMMAESLQTRLLLDQTKQEKVLALKELELTSNLSTVPLLTLDRENTIIRANQKARFILGEDCIGDEFHVGKGYSVELISDQSQKFYSSVVSLNEANKKDETAKKLYSTSDIIGSCPKIEKVRNMITKAAFFDYPVIIYGKSGTGKELIAQSLHSHGSRFGKPFVAVNCSAIPENLIESELFGYEKGAFTGANQKGSPGKFEAANGGTIFLDEIGDMSLKAQAALLRVLQESIVTRVGGVKVIPINTRVIAATNKNLREEIKAGRFREDLYYRLKGIFITLPPLKDRTDILELTEHFINTLDHSPVSLSEEAKQKILAYHWPGNIRELKSVLIQASFLAVGNEIKADDLHFEDVYEQQTQQLAIVEKKPSSLRQTEKEAITQALTSAVWNISKAARILKISRNTLYLKMKKYGL
ncbi:sigma-54-dependent Fis family transcriptional regulator [Domibacillus sp. DTU_2020_1001157_1_SI_ALB_TIR_016]|uniref:sigma-54-dependent Fis family transcriptional regulator n=1 Tax=Domibacillus sp. DTU_2020_1001157_1_SI_ALB_TIR_016 TaxID=3077789 RepID=UPI0028F0AAB7|nr:sigma-54-dependent Fis family transcriptional regulator [Domibacillus sp. DTU_2020_1001157_1_SI_ALB_TIR_016]WNS79539.1 sigma-54-dependent Fis family transcriptional regulator [Domibacillus sp. DTU_2020_1001157_1_SI_ALB_TIR_016]